MSSIAIAANAYMRRRHFEYFPHGQTVSKTLIDEVLSMLVYKTVGEIDHTSPPGLLR